MKLTPTIFSNYPYMFILSYCNAFVNHVRKIENSLIFSVFYAGFCLIQINILFVHKFSNRVKCSQSPYFKVKFGDEKDQK
jgi:hypothetical protein